MQNYHIVLLTMVLLMQACTTTTTGRKGESPEKAAQYNAQLGINYMTKQGNLEQARIKLERALEQNEKNPLANLGYAQLQTVVGNKDKADKHFKRAIELEPLNANSRNAYAVYLCQEGKTTEAMAQFDRAIENRYYKTPEIALDNAGVCLIDSRNLLEAEEYLVRAVKANPRYAPALLNLADLNLQKHEIPLADAYFSRFAKLGGETPSSLWVGYQIKRGQGKKDEASALSDKLLRNHPNSIQAGELLKTTIND